MAVYTAAQITAKIETLQGYIDNIQAQIDEWVIAGALPYSADSESIDPAKMISSLQGVIDTYQKSLEYWEKRLRQVEGTGFVTTRVFGVNS